MAVTVSAALLLGAVFAGDSVWTALAALLVAGGWGALALLGRVPAPGSGVVLGGLLLATAAWSGLSIAWSVAPDLSWAELNRTLVYAAFLAVGLLLGALRQGAKLAAAALTVALGAGVVWALAGKAIPAVFPDGGRAARLRDPIGYWNALALAADALLVLALSFAASSRAVAVRAAGRRSPTRRSWQCCSRPRAPASRPRSSGSCSGSGSAATGSRRRCSCSSRPFRPRRSPAGRSRGRRSSRTARRGQTALRTERGSG